MTATTPDAATTVRRLLEAFLSGDMETLMSCADDEIEWNPAQHNPVITRQYRGREQWLNGAVAAVAEGFDGFRFDIEHSSRSFARSGVFTKAGELHARLTRARGQLWAAKIRTQPALGPIRV